MKIWSIEALVQSLQDWSAVDPCSGGFKGGKGGANPPHPPLAASIVFLRTYLRKSIK